MSNFLKNKFLSLFMLNITFECYELKSIIFNN